MPSIISMPSAGSTKFVDCHSLPCKIDADPGAQHPVSIYFKPAKYRKVGGKNCHYSELVIEPIEEAATEEAEVVDEDENDTTPTTTTTPIPSETIDDDTVPTNLLAANLRGRQLIGRPVALPENSIGLVLKKKKSSKQLTMFASKSNQDDLTDSQLEEIGIDGPRVECVGVFKEIVHWGHDFAPGGDQEHLGTTLRDHVENMAAVHGV